MKSRKLVALSVFVSNLRCHYDELREAYSNCFWKRKYCKNRMKGFGTEYEEKSTYDFYRYEFLFYKHSLSLLEDELRCAKRRYLHYNNKLSVLCNKK